MKVFPSDKDLVEFADSFAAIHIERFEKDMAICLTGQSWPTSNDPIRHAYFPALIACIGVLDLFSGLRIGRLNPPPGLLELKAYAQQFPAVGYGDLLLAILYNCFRHKVAHMAHPYDVFDTDKKPRDFVGEPRRRITWIVDSASRPKALDLTALPTARLLERAPASWGVTYDHVIHVSLPRLRDDIIRSVVDTDGYLNALHNDADLRANFQICMNEYFCAN